MFSPDQWAASTGVAFYNGVATQSLRFDRGSTAYLSRTPSASNRRTWTWSGWVKRGNLGNFHSLFSATTELASGNSHSYIAFNNDGLIINNYTYPSGTNWNLQTNALFRDVSAWYHIVLVVDTTQATSTDRLKLYVNGEQVTSFSSSTYPSQNYEGFINSTYKHKIGNAYIASSTYGLDGYKAEVNFVDGQALTPTSFGETKNGVWIAKEYTGSYGTNGFRLQFNQTGTGTASSSTIGADTSGNANHFTSSGIVASDCDMPDSPENNFCTLNPLNTGDAVLSEGNLKTPNLTTDTNNLVASTFQVANGKWYWEFLYDNVDADYAHIGITQTNGYDVQSFDNYLGYRADQWSIFAGNGNKRNNQSFDSYGSGFSDNDIGMIALDMDNNKIWWGKNGTWFNSGDPASGTNAGFTNLSGEVTPALSSRDIVYYNFGQDSSFVGNTTAQGNTDGNGIGDFYYSPPSGYLALCTSNLPEPTISPNADTQADDYFNTATYSGNSSTQDITSVGFQPDWVWIKSRSNASNHYLTDVVRGTSKGLQTNIANAEVTNTNVITSFNSDGFSLGNDATANVANITGRTYVSWNWKAGGTAVSNTDGSITSSVSANTDAGFSIVNYTGTGSSATVGHGLGKKPSLIFIKRRAESSNWAVAGSALGSTATLYLNLTNAQETYSDPVIINTQTTTTFSIGTDTNRNKNTFEHIAYCFAEIEGYSRFGKYIGNGNADGTFVYTGFRPAFVILRRSDGTSDWFIWDDKRNENNPTNRYQQANLSDAEGSGIGDGVDFLSNGFKVRSSHIYVNVSGASHIYMAFAENPFKYANAR